MSKPVTGMSAVPEWEGRRVALVGLALGHGTTHTAEEHLERLHTRLTARGAHVVYHVIQRRRAPEAATYIGRGKAEQLGALCAFSGIEAVVVDSALSASQIRNLTLLVGRAIYDRGSASSRRGAPVRRRRTADRRPLRRPVRP